MAAKQTSAAKSKNKRHGKNGGWQKMSAAAANVINAWHGVKRWRRQSVKSKHRVIAVAEK